MSFSPSRTAAELLESAINGNRSHVRAELRAMPIAHAVATAYHLGILASDRDADEVLFLGRALTNDLDEVAP